MVPAPLLTSPIVVASTARSSCKEIPENPNWPSDADWAGLDKAVGGRLSKPAPLAAVCHRE